MQILLIMYHPCRGCWFWRAASSHKVLGHSLINSKTFTCAAPHINFWEIVWENQASTATEHTWVSLYLQHVWSKWRSTHVRACGAWCGNVWCWEVMSGRWGNSVCDLLSHRAPCWYNQHQHISLWRKSEGEVHFFDSCWCWETAS